jgi:ElaA protein
VRIAVHTFDDLPPGTLYELLRLRAAVFVVEQDCPYQDLDGQDQAATHVLGWMGERLVAYARVHDENGTPRVGRVVTAADLRSVGLGHDILRASLDVIGDRPCFLHAQDHLRDFYAQHGFTPVGEIFDEDGIPHIRMDRAGSA